MTYIIVWFSTILTSAVLTAALLESVKYLYCKLRGGASCGFRIKADPLYQRLKKTAIGVCGRRSSFSEKKDVEVTSRSKTIAKKDFYNE